MRSLTHTSFAGLAAFSVTVALAVTTGCSGSGARSADGEPDRYEDLVAFFSEWREFQQPQSVDGVPDYSAAAMARQHRELESYQSRLTAMDTSGWSVAQQVDYHVVQAELNGLDFDHRVLRPWSRMPGFYTMIHPAQSDVPAHEGPFVNGWIDVWTYDFPLTPEAAARLAGRLRVIPPLLEQARENLKEAIELVLEANRQLVEEELSGKELIK